MKLKQAFDVLRGDVVAFIGAGGKTSLLVGLGYELAETGWRVLATTTGQLSTEQLALFPAAMPTTADAQSISQALNQHQFVLLHEQIQSGRVYGPAVEWTRQLLDAVDSDILLVEADDAAGMPFKAPLANQPQIPLETSLVVSVASLSALGLPLNDEHIYNPQAMIDKYGFVENSPVKSPWLAQVLRDEELGLRGVPQNARVVIYLNQTPQHGFVRGRARMIARLSLQSERITAVALGEVRGVEPVYELQRTVGALVLAAGNSPCQDPNKILQPWGNGTTAVAHVTEQMIRSRIDHIRVVTGYRSPDVRAAVKALGVKTVHNRGYAAGGMVTSLKVGLHSLPAHISAVLLAPGDQARIQPKAIYHILAAYARGEGDFLIPCYQNRHGHPILIGRRYWHEILKLPRNTGLREIIEDYEAEITFLNMDSDCILHEADVARRYPLARSSAGIKNRSV